ncbi:MAG: type I-E CRISPR-associated protein Cas6/Cse3/CasE [Pseudomonadota bacterium]|nr:type I-E CRISPR-associated protein Cas6/Cse3/CasE [Pseudomonadota bacterium]
MLETIMTFPTPETAYASHQAVWNALKREDGVKRNFLFRVVPSRQSGLSLIKIRSLEMPENIKPITCHKPESGSHYQFSLLAHPVKRISGQEYALKTEAEVKSWLEMQLERNGMNLVSCCIEFIPAIPLGKKKFNISLHAVEIHGRLLIINAHKAESAMIEGIGRCKSMGFGMLELKEIDNA